MHAGWRPAEGGPEFGSGCVVIVEANVAAGDKLGESLQARVDDPLADPASSENFGDGQVGEVASSSVVATQNGANDLRIQNRHLAEARVSLEIILDLFAAVGRFVKPDAVRCFPKIADFFIVFNLHRP